MNATAVGILGIGTYFPEEIRTNDWWPPEEVARWNERTSQRATSGVAPQTELTEGERLTFAAMARYAGDPFRGARTRHVMPAGMTTSQMEAHAAREALSRAGVRLDEVGVLLTQGLCPDQIMVNQASVTHRELGLPQVCFALETDAACNGFAMHATLAQSMIASGVAKYVLSAHSIGYTRMQGLCEPHSAWFGDGAAAVVFGPVSEGRGIKVALHQADGSTANALAIGVPGREWWEPGRIVMYTPDRSHTSRMLTTLAERARTTITAALRAANLEPSDVGFYACHQGTVWLSEVTAQIAGLAHVPTISTFSQYANLGSANVPVILAAAEREGRLADDMPIVTFSGGVGETWSSLVIRWGR